MITGADFELPLPAGARKLLPPDGIPAIYEPKFVDGSTAEIAGDEFVIGLEIDGDARAYSMNLLDRHEIVNDVVGGQQVITTW